MKNGDTKKKRATIEGVLSATTAAAVAGMVLVAARKWQEKTRLRNTGGN